MRFGLVDTLSLKQRAEQSGKLEEESLEVVISQKLYNVAQPPKSSFGSM